MKKVRAIREFPHAIKDVVYCRDEQYDLTAFDNKEQIKYHIEDGWSADVVRNPTLEGALKEHLRGYTPTIHPSIVKNLAKIAMTHAVEVTQKALDDWNKNKGKFERRWLGDHILDALKKEAEGI